MRWEHLRYAMLSSLLAFILVPVTSVPADIMEDFSSGLGAWQISGDVSVDAGAAVLGDSGEFYSSLYYEAILGAGSYTIEFDFLNGLSSDTTIGFPDTFYGSLYFVNDIADFDLATLAFDDALATLSADYLGDFENYGTIEGSVLGGDWLHFSMNFNNVYNYVIPTFEFFDFNFVDDDSTFSIDSVSIVEAAPVPVPEPASLAIFGIGMTVLAVRKQKQRWSINA